MKFAPCLCCGKQTSQPDSYPLVARSYCSKKCENTEPADDWDDSEGYIRGPNEPRAPRVHLSKFAPPPGKAE